MTSFSFIFLQIKFRHFLYSYGSLSYGGSSYDLRKTNYLALQPLDGKSERLISPGVYFHKEGLLKFLISQIQFLMKTNQLSLVIHASTVVEALQKCLFISSKPHVSIIDLENLAPVKAAKS